MNNCGYMTTRQEQENVRARRPQTMNPLYSLGLIAHLDSPRPLLHKHVEVLNTYKTRMILIPDDNRPYGCLHRYCAPDEPRIRNLDIMMCDALETLSLINSHSKVKTKRVGRLDPALLSPHKRWPASIARAIHFAFNALGVVQLFDIPSLCPWIALQAVRAR